MDILVCHSCVLRVGIQSLLLALRHVRCNWNFKCSFYFITLKNGTLLLIDFPKVLAISDMFGMDNWARGFRFCCYYHADQCTGYFLSCSRGTSTPCQNPCKQAGHSLYLSEEYKPSRCHLLFYCNVL